MKKILFIFGTRPEIIKLAPVIAQLQKEEEVFEIKTCHTGQHDELAQQAIDLFKIQIDFSLNVMVKNQSLDILTATLIKNIGSVLDEYIPDFVIIQGDTTTAFVAALSAFYRQIKIVHVEAGLRTFDKTDPFPEEINRQLISRLAEYHFAPTEKAQQNLWDENIGADKIVVTGNTIVDSLQWIQEKGLLKSPEVFLNRTLFSPDEKFIVFTLHRRESWGSAMDGIFKSIAKIAEELNIRVIYPVHPNPEIIKKASAFFAEVPKVQTIEALSYNEMLWLISRSYLIITDSGGIQEEASSFNKPVVVARNKTERRELIEANGGILAGTDPLKIFDLVKALVRDELFYKSNIASQNPFGMGDASIKIRDYLLDVL